MDLGKQVRDLRSSGQSWAEIAQKAGKSIRTVQRWANGEQEPQSDPILKDRIEIFCVNDVHVPYHDPILFERAVAHCEHIQPDVLVINGDFYDCTAASKHVYNPHEHMDIAGEVSVGQSLLERLCENAGRVVYLEGNHEVRLRSLPKERTPGLARSISSREILQLGWVDEYYGYREWYEPIPGLAFTHGEFARKVPGGSVRAQGEYYDGHLFMGHIHRYEHVQKAVGIAGKNQRLVHQVGAGHMCDPVKVPKSASIHTTSWQPVSGTHITAVRDGDQAKIEFKTYFE